MLIVREYLNPVRTLYKKELCIISMPSHFAENPDRNMFCCNASHIYIDIDINSLWRHLGLNQLVLSLPLENFLSSFNTICLAVF